MAIRRYRQQQPPRQSLPQSAEPRQVIVQPVKGINSLVHPSQVLPGETPRSQNFVRYERWLTQRSGLSNHGSSLISAQPVLAARAQNARGVEYTILGSINTISYIRTDSLGTQWATLAGPTTSSSTSYYYAAATIYNDADFEQNLILTNGIDVPKRWIVSQRTLSLLSSFASVESFAGYVTGFDDRAVFFNCGTSDSSRYPTRLRWSKRGTPSNLTDADAGYEDLRNMRGFGTGIVTDRDRMLLFTDKEIWQARRRGDAFVFDYLPINTKIGCPFPRTIVNSAEGGTFFVGGDYQVYRIFGTELDPVGAPIHSFIKDTLVSSDLIWALYNESINNYQLYYSSTAASFGDQYSPNADATNGLTLSDTATGERFALSGGLLILVETGNINAVAGGIQNGYLTLYSPVDYPSTSLWINPAYISPAGLNSAAVIPWFLQDFGSTYKFACGVGDEIVSSVGSVYRFDSAYTTDDGITMDARWRSHGIKAAADPMQLEAATELYMDYQAFSASSVSIWFSTDLGATFTASQPISLTSAMSTVRVPLTSPPARHHMFELRATGQPLRVSSFQLGMRSYSGRLIG